MLYIFHISIIFFYFIFLANSEFQRYVIRKLTDITFKISSIDKQQKHFNDKLYTIHTTLQRIETFYSNEKIQDKETEENLMDNFPISNIEDLEQFEKLLIYIYILKVL